MSAFAFANHLLPSQSRGRANKLTGSQCAGLAVFDSAFTSATGEITVIDLTSFRKYRVCAGLFPHK